MTGRSLSKRNCPALHESAASSVKPCICRFCTEPENNEYFTFAKNKRSIAYIELVYSDARSKEDRSVFLSLNVPLHV